MPSADHCMSWELYDALFGPGRTQEWDDAIQPDPSVKEYIDGLSWCFHVPLCWVIHLSLWQFMLF